MPSDQTNLYYSAEGPREPAYRREVINRRMVYAMFSLALLTLAYVSYAVFTDQPLTGTPEAAPVVFERSLVLTGDGNAVTVFDTDQNRMLLNTSNGGFVSVVIDGLERARFLASVEGNPAVTITQYENGRLQLSDPASGWSAELASFGPGDLKVWQAVLAQ